MKNSFVILSISLILLFSCKDEPSPSRFELLTGNVWRIISIEIGGQVQVLPQCYSDDEITFYKDGEFEWVYGTNRCADLAFIDGDWELRSGDSKLMWEISGESVFQILEISSAKLRLELTGSATSQILTLESVN